MKIVLSIILFTTFPLFADTAHFEISKTREKSFVLKDDNPDHASLDLYMKATAPKVTRFLSLVKFDERYKCDGEGKFEKNKNGHHVWYISSLEHCSKM